MNHSSGCNKLFDQHKQHVAEFKAKFPNHCRKCNGWGGFWSTYDPSPSGVALSPGTMTDFDSCSECWDKGICPRCGKELKTQDEIDAGVEMDNCSHCGWTAEGLGDTGGILPEPECYCYYSYIQEEY